VSQAAGVEDTGLSVEPLTPAFGAQLGGLDLSLPVSDDLYEAIHDAFIDHSLLVIPDQHLTPEQLIAFSRRFGDLEHHVLQDLCLAGHPEIFVVSNIVENGRYIGAHGGSKKYHADLAYLDEPSLGSLFYCLECPEGEGETAFISMRAVYDALPEDRKRWLEGKSCVFDFVWHHEQNHKHRTPMTEEQKAKVPPVTHPAVVSHPESGRRSLLVSEYHCRRFDDMTEEESRPIIDELLAFAQRPEFGYIHSWTPGDLVIWDNRCLLHKAMPFDETNARRLMHRTTVKGAKPVLRPV
jgi:taurine dioxygenase